MCTPLDSWEIINLDSEAVDKAEKEAREVEQLRMNIARHEEERKLVMDEVSQLKEMLKREVFQSEKEKDNYTAIINDNNLIRQKLEAQLHSIKTEYEELKVRTLKVRNLQLFITFLPISLKFSVVVCNRKVF